jgi:cadmium resistance protein CadD (predicted permease)
LLGFLPIFIGVKSLVLHVNKRGLVEEEEEKTAVSSNKSAMLSVAAVTIANGGDNIGIYVPLFATLSIASKLIMILIFLLLILPWCFIAMYLVKHPAVAKAIDKYGDIITPILFILLGLYILFESGTVRMFSSLVQ